MSDQSQRAVITSMAERAEQCRRLAKGIGDDASRIVLLKMAEEIETDIRILEAQEANRDQSE